MSELIFSKGALQPNQSYDVLMGMERIMFESDDKVDPAVRHYLGGGTYAREMIMREDYLISGAVHRLSTITIILEGEVLSWSNHGTSETHVAGQVLVTPAHTKRLWYSAQGARLLTIHSIPLNMNAINEHTLQELEKHILVPESEGDA